MKFGEVLELLKVGRKFYREGWHGQNQQIALQVPDEHSANTLPYIYLEVDGARVPWVASHTDLLSEDWQGRG